jgi:hypothetical protein
MELLKSLRFLIIGVLKRIYWVLPTLLLNPFDIVERLFNVSYEVPQWTIWVLFAAGWAVAILLSYHELRMQKIALEKSPNWIDAYKIRHGSYPPLPDYLLPVVIKYSPGEPVSKDIELITASAQFWNRLLPSQQDELRELAEWLGQDPRDYEAQVLRMLPRKAPKRAARWKTPEQH